MTIQIQSITRFFMNGFAGVWRHMYALLLLFFIAVMGLAGFIFWQYGYQASLQEPEVTVRTVATKEKELRALIEKMNERDASRGAIVRKTFQNPFIKPEGSQP